jgi:hypothetical protein
MEDIMGEKKATDKAKKARLDAMFADQEKCFGKIYDTADDECKKCLDSNDCQQYFSKDKEPAPEKTEEKPAEKKAGKSKPAEKPEPAKAEKKPVSKKEADKAAVDATAKKAKGNPFDRSADKDANGYVVGSKASTIFGLLLEGKHTRDDIIEKVVKKHGGSEGTNKNTVSTFIYDVQKDKGYSSVARGLKVNKSDKGVLSIAKSK